MSMANPIFNDIAIPCFDLTWVELPKHKEEKTTSVAFVAGGGGNKTKSGVLNKIVVFKFVGAGGVEEVTSIDCQHGLCENLCTTMISGRVVICASFQQKCVLMEVTRDKADNIRAKDLATFGAEELKEEDMSINASCFVHVGGKEGKGTFVVTGGENGHTHVWKITEGRKGREVEWKVEKVKEFSYHKGPIKAIRPHPTRPWICTGGEDGTCRLIDIDSLSLLSTVNCTSDGVGSGGKTPQCRACAFSKDGEFLFTVQSGRMGNAHLVKWDVSEQENADDILLESEKKLKRSSKKATHAPRNVIVSPNMVVLASKFPITRLSVNTEIDSLAVGDCDGAISIFNTESLKKMNRYQCHDFPVTGMGFAPRSVLLEHDDVKKFKAKSLLFSCSADNKLSAILVQDSTMTRNLVIFLLLVLFVVGYIIMS